MEEPVQKNRDEEQKESKNEVSREVWLDDDALSEISNDAPSTEDGEPEKNDEEK